MTAGISIAPRRFLFVLWEGGGNIPPQLGLARRLVERGHQVRVISDPCNEGEAREAGCSFVPYTRAPHRNDKSAGSTIVKDYEAKNPAEAFKRFADTIMFDPALDYAQDVLGALEEWPADVVVISEGLFGGAFAAEKANLPCVMIIPGIYTLPAPGLPLAGTGFFPATGPIGRLRDGLFGAMSNRALKAGLPRLNAARIALGLPALQHWSEMIDHLERILVLTSPAFDFKADSLPPQVRYAGPIIDDPTWADAWQSPWPGDHPHPLVVVGLSTTFQNQGALLERVIGAFDGLPLRGLVTLGPTLSVDQFHAPQNVVICQSAPHAQVFPQAAAVVTHAGHGTVIKALAYGLPLVCIPMGRDQAGIAARVVARGAGLRLTPKASVESLRTTIQQVAGDPGFRENARYLSNIIMDDVRQTCGIDELEQVAQSAPELVPG
jgi:MGT family glycosyltransferase